MTLAKKRFTYRAVLDDEKYSYISFPGHPRWGIVLSKTNTRPVYCAQCGGEFIPGECVYHRQRAANYYICIPCAKNLVTRYGRDGFTVNVLFNLQVVFFGPPKYSAVQVSESITKFICQRSPEGIEILFDLEELPCN